MDNGKKELIEAVANKLRESMWMSYIQCHL